MVNGCGGGGLGGVEPRKVLLVTSTGGHLEELTQLEPRLRPSCDEVHYSTFDDQHSRSLLRDRDVRFVERIPPRGWREAVRVAVPARRILREGHYTDVISTGSAIAVPFLTQARMMGMRGHYIESAARSEGPSVTGRIVARIPGVHLYTQYENWAGNGWLHRGSVFDRFVALDSRRTSSSASRVVVTLGTMRRYPFRRAVDAVLSILAEVARPDADILWQVGDTPVADLGIRGHEMLPAKEMGDAIGEADLVFAHAGIGSCLQILDRGRAPVLLPRLSEKGEHIDDHQLLIARELDHRRLAVSRDPLALTARDAFEAMGRQVATAGMPRDFQLAR